MVINPTYLNGFRVFPFGSNQEMLDFLIDRKGILVAMNAEKITRANPVLRELVNKNIGYADGVGAVYGLRQKGAKKAIKIAGAEFWLNIIKEFNNTKSFYLVGSTQEVVESAVTKLRREYPGIVISNYRNGYLQKGDENRLVEDLLEKKPDVVFIAMGTPKQEMLMQRLFDEHEALYMGLGGSFDVYSGNKKRAPKIWINLGLEWLYRLLKEPTRLRRQLVLLKFFFLLLFGRL